MSDAPRNDLRRIHERIAVLEGQLRELDSPPVPHTPAWSWALLGLFLGPMAAFALTALGAGIWAAIPSEPPPTVHETPETLGTVTPPRRTIGAQWYPQSDVSPLSIDVNGDGQEDMLGLAWKGGGEKQLLAVAIDGKTFEPLWSAGPFRGTWHSEVTHILLANGRVVVTDAAGDLHVLALTTGKEDHTISYPAGVEIACDAPNSDVLLVSSSRWGNHGTEAFDLSTGLSIEIPKGRTCRESYGVDRNHSSRENVLSASLEPRFKMPARTYAPRAFEVGDITFAPGRHERDAKEGDARGEAFGIAWNTKSAKVLWQHPLIDSPDVEHEATRFTLVADKSVITAYQAETQPRKGPFRIVAWDVTTGEKQWATTLPSSAEGSWLGAMGTGAGRIFVVTNQGVCVIDRSSGNVITTLEQL